MNAERPSWTDRDDQLGAGFHDIQCAGCGTSVRVRKMHPRQTSTQWTGPVTCEYLAPDELGRSAPPCPLLSATIAAAVGAGRIPVEPR